MPEIGPLGSHLCCRSHLSPPKRVLWNHLLTIYYVFLSLVIAVAQITVIFEIFVVRVKLFLHPFVPFGREGTSFLENKVGVAHHFGEVSLHQRTDITLFVRITHYIVGEILMESHRIHVLGTVIQFFEVREVVVVHVFDICVSASMKVHEVPSKVVDFLHRRQVLITLM